ncbi:hypothetical protein ACHAXA_004983 [Cyclostephanos tholiformis]|uniref:Uncharacterized protein n=1 Tax=Cyclostephanos tholiformis TaxID=382380 RepID=A0ABD3R5P7_9STRA
MVGCGEVQTAPTSSPTATDIDDSDSSSSSHGDCAADGPSGRIVQSLFRFPASRLGPEFDELVRYWYADWLRIPDAEYGNGTTADPPPITPEPAGVDHAFHSVSTAAATLFRRQCYGPAPRTTSRMHNLYSNFEQRRKEIAFQRIEDGAEEMRLMHTMTKRFYPAFREDGDAVTTVNGDVRYHGTSRMHEKKSKSTTNTVYADSAVPSDCDTPSKLSFQTKNGGNRRTQEWSWYPPGHFSDRGIPGNIDFRTKMYASMRREFQDRLRRSGMAYQSLGLGGEYEGQGRRETGGGDFATQVWRMYLVRTTRDPVFDLKLAKLRKIEEVDRGSDDHSAMHIIPGDDDGITLEVLLGSRRCDDGPMNSLGDRRPISDEDRGIRKVEDDTAFDRNAVWRIPDRDGYVTLFRLPDIWHCIVSEEVHRYSLGFAFSDKEVQALLKLADVDFDVVNGNGDTCGDRTDDKSIDPLVTNTP